jgi:hypothetical protein
MLSMRFPRVAIFPLLGILAVSARPGHAQIGVNAQIGSPQYEVRVSPYATDVYGDWRTSYSRWQPVTLYSTDGHFYSRSVPGARAVSVYRSQNQYFLPPRDAEFATIDRRFNYDRRPIDDDYNIVQGVASLFGVTPQRSWGDEVFVNNYSPEAYGDWRSNYRRWQSVTLYNRNGRYYPIAIPGARAVAVYHSQNQYFLPPTDDQWQSADSRYDYRRAPTQEDYNNPQRSPGQYGQRAPGRTIQGPSTGYLNDVSVAMYSPQLHGEWQTVYTRWEPATLYNLNGKYYPNPVQGGRSLMVYRSQGQYFLPPRDQGWTNTDRRYNYLLRPTDQDYTSIQRPPGGP